MRRTELSWMALATSTLVACAPGLVGASHPDVPDLTIVTAVEGAKSGIVPTDASVTFGEGQDGTNVLVEFLKSAKKRGARYVSDLRITIVSEQDGKPVACETRVAPVEEVTSVEVPGRTKVVPTMEPVSRMVTESQYRCQMVSKPVMRSETTYTSQYDYMSKTTRQVPQTRLVTQYEMQNECRFEPVTHMVTRYEFQYRTQYVPPHLESVSRQRLKETQATCFLPESDVPGALGKNRVEAKLYIPAPSP